MEQDFIYFHWLYHISFIHPSVHGHERFLLQNSTWCWVVGFYPEFLTETDHKDPPDFSLTFISPESIFVQACWGSITQSGSLVHGHREISKELVSSHCKQWENWTKYIKQAFFWHWRLGSAGLWSQREGTRTWWVLGLPWLSAWRSLPDPSAEGEPKKSRVVLLSWWEKDQSSGRLEGQSSTERKLQKESEGSEQVPLNLWLNRVRLHKLGKEQASGSVLSWNFPKFTRGWEMFKFWPARVLYTHHLI